MVTWCFCSSNIITTGLPTFSLTNWRRNCWGSKFEFAQFFVLTFASSLLSPVLKVCRCIFIWYSVIQTVQCRLYTTPANLKLYKTFIIYIRKLCDWERTQRRWEMELLKLSLIFLLKELVFLGAFWCWKKLKERCWYPPSGELCRYYYSRTRTSIIGHFLFGWDVMSWLSFVTGVTLARWFPLSLTLTCV